MALSPSQSQLILPLLEALDAAGGEAPPATVYDDVAERLRLPLEERGRRVPVRDGATTVNAFERSVRWARQKAKLMGLVESPRRNHWQLTGRGRQALREAAPGVVITIYETDSGVALWGSCEDAVGYIEFGSVQLILTSPPYPLLRQKAYGNLASQEYVDWLVGLIDGWKRVLTADGSIVLNLGDVWEPGRPTQDLYQERLLIRLVDEIGLRLAQRFEWLNPSKLPAPAEWVSIRRVRVKPGLERILWLSPSDHPYADNRAVLRPYSEAMRNRLSAGGDRAGRRPSGHGRRDGAFGLDNGGAIPDNLIVEANTESGGPYMRYCRERGLPIHPARFPRGIPEFFLRLLARKGDTVWEPFAGSNQTGEVAEELGVNWIASELCLDYLMGSIGRFASRPGLTVHAR